MTRGDVWLAETGGKQRPVLVLTRTEVLDVRSLVTVAEITTRLRGIGAEVILDHSSIGLERESAVNCDGIHTIAQSVLSRRIGRVDGVTMQRVCSALTYALAC